MADVTGRPRARARIASLLERWRVARVEAQQAREFLRQRREVEHQERLRAGIKDVQPGGGSFL